MIPFKSPLLLTVPPTLEKRLEALAALRTLLAQDEELVRQRRAAIAAVRRDLEQMQREVGAIRPQLVAEVRADVLRMLKYNPDEPRVPKRSSHGGEWTSEDGSGSSPDSVARPVADEHPSSERGPQYAQLQTDTQTDATEDTPHSQPQRPKDGDADVAASGSKSEDAASLHDLVVQYYREQIQDRGYDDLTAPGFHTYSTGWDLICSTGDSCTLENARSSVLAYQVPGYDGMTEGGGEYPVTLPGIGYIGDVHVYDNGLSISNLTLPGHALYFGYITNTLEVRPDGIYVQTFGEGVNTSQSLADINAILGSRLFTQRHALMRQYFDANFGPN
jgi:hypothetical protein